MDPPEHAVYRRLIEPYFSEDRLRAFEPVCRRVVAESLQRALTGGPIELISDFALDVSVRIHCAFLGWPDSLRTTLADWTLGNHEATRADDRPALARFAREFENLVADLLEQRRRTHAGPEADITAALMHETVRGRPLDDREISSILRNWTVGEIGTTSAASAFCPLPQRASSTQAVCASSVAPACRHRRICASRPSSQPAGCTHWNGRTIAAGDGDTELGIVTATRAFTTQRPADHRISRRPALRAGVHICRLPLRDGAASDHEECGRNRHIALIRADPSQPTRQRLFGVAAADSVILFPAVGLGRVVATPCAVHRRQPMTRHRYEHRRAWLPDRNRSRRCVTGLQSG